MYKYDSALDNLEGLICHRIKLIKPDLQFLKIDLVWWKGWINTYIKNFDD